jgi:tripartite-type tricarboxylate transporter receptor subunit TctC
VRHFRSRFRTLAGLPIQIVVPQSAGSALDIVTRIVAGAFTRLEQPVIVRTDRRW